MKYPAIPTPEQIEAFIKDLTALTIKHGISIGGCSCCGSPYLQIADPPISKYDIISKTADCLEWEKDK